MVDSGITLTMTFDGPSDLRNLVLDSVHMFKDDFLGVLTEEAEEIMAESKLIVPVDQGILKGSAGHYGTEEKSDGSVTVRYGYGGEAASYAVIQHETPPHIFRHAEGQSWKYLEIPVFEAVTTMGARMSERLAARIASRFTGGGGSGAVFGDE